MAKRSPTLPGSDRVTNEGKPLRAEWLAYARLENLDPEAIGWVVSVDGEAHSMVDMLADNEREGWDSWLPDVVQGLTHQPTYVHDQGPGGRSTWNRVTFTDLGGGLTSEGMATGSHLANPTKKDLIKLAEDMMVADLGEDWLRDPSRKKGRDLLDYFGSTYGDNWWEPAWKARRSRRTTNRGEAMSTTRTRSTKKSKPAGVILSSKSRAAVEKALLDAAQLHNDPIPGTNLDRVVDRAQSIAQHVSSLSKGKVRIRVTAQVKEPTQPFGFYQVTWTLTYAPSDRRREAVQERLNLYPTAVDEVAYQLDLAHVEASATAVLRWKFRTPEGTYTLKQLVDANLGGEGDISWIADVVRACPKVGDGCRVGRDAWVRVGSSGSGGEAMVTEARSALPVKSIKTRLRTRRTSILKPIVLHPASVTGSMDKRADALKEALKASIPFQRQVDAVVYDDGKNIVLRPRTSWEHTGRQMEKLLNRAGYNVHPEARVDAYDVEGIWHGLVEQWTPQALYLSNPRNKRLEDQVAATRLPAERQRLRDAHAAWGRALTEEDVDAGVKRKSKPWEAMSTGTTLKGKWLTEDEAQAERVVLRERATEIAQAAGGDPGAVLKALLTTPGIGSPPRTPTEAAKHPIPGHVFQAAGTWFNQWDLIREGYPEILVEPDLPLGFLTAVRGLLRELQRRWKRAREKGSAYPKLSDVTLRGQGELIPKGGRKIYYSTNYDPDAWKLPRPGTYRKRTEGMSTSAKLKPKSTSGPIRLDMPAAFEVCGLDPEAPAKLVESNESYLGGVYSENLRYYEAQDDEDAEEKAMDAEREASDALWTASCDAMEATLNWLCENHGLEVSKNKKGEILLKPTKDWRDVANRIRETINGVGYFEFNSLKEFLDSGPYSPREAVVSHLHWMKDYPSVYGDGSTESFYQRKLRGALR